MKRGAGEKNLDVADGWVKARTQSVRRH